MTPLKLWLHTAWGCNYQSFACPSYCLDVRLLWYPNLLPWSQGWRLRSACMLNTHLGLCIYSRRDGIGYVMCESFQLSWNVLVGRNDVSDMCEIKICKGCDATRLCNNYWMWSYQKLMMWYCIQKHVKHTRNTQANNISKTKNFLLANFNTSCVMGLLQTPPPP